MGLRVISAKLLTCRSWAILPGRFARKFVTHVVTKYTDTVTQGEQRKKILKHFCYALVATAAILIDNKLTSTEGA